MPKENADETVTVRLPKGTARKLVAATGQPFSRIVRFIVMQMLHNYEAQGKLSEDARDVLRADVAQAAQEVTDGTAAS